jgi:hypothetical protein
MRKIIFQTCRYEISFRRSCRYMQEKAGPQGRQDLLWKAGSRDLKGINNRLHQKSCLLAECGKTFLFSSSFFLFLVNE